MRASGTPVLVGRRRRALVRPRLRRPRSRDRVEPAARAAGHRRPRLHPRLRGAGVASTSATGSGEIGAPVLAVAGADDPVTTTEHLRAIATGVRRGALVELPDTSHLAPAERPAEVAALIRRHALGTETEMTPGYEAGMQVRREVLGDEHVDRAVAGTTDFTRDFQELITTYAWGEIWTRPGLDRRSRSIITLTALIARGHDEELAMHLRAALRNGLTVDEIKEVILQSAIYCGVPDANTAFRIAQQVLEEERRRD